MEIVIGIRICRPLNGGGLLIMGLHYSLNHEGIPLNQWSLILLRSFLLQGDVWFSELSIAEASVKLSSELTRAEIRLLA